MIVSAITKENGHRKVEVFNERGFHCIPTDGGSDIKVPIIKLGGKAVDGLPSDELVEESLNRWLIEDPSRAAGPGALIVGQDVIVDIPVNEDDTRHIVGLEAGCLWEMPAN